MLIGLAIRLIYIGVHDRRIEPFSDAFWYHGGANFLADGHGFIDPISFELEGTKLPGAGHPPGYIVALAIPSVLGFTSVLAHQVWSAFLSTTMTGAVGLLGRRLAGNRAGLVAACLAAVYPNFFVYDALLASESLVLPCVAITLLAAYWFWERPSGRRAAILGVSCGVTALARSETILLLVLLVLPCCAFLRQLSVRRRAALLSAAGVSALVVIAPWAVFNLLRFERPVLLSTPDHTLLAGNCPEVYEGDHIGFFTVNCLLEASCPDGTDDAAECLLRTEPGGDASTQALVFRRAALENMRENLGDLPRVVLAREGRAFGFFRPGQQLVIDQLSSKEIELSRVALAMYYALAVGFVAGAVVLRRRGTPVFPLFAPIAGVALAVSMTFGETRYRAVAEVPLAVGAAVAIDAALSRRQDVRKGRLAPRRHGCDGDEPVAAVGAAK